MGSQNLLNKRALVGALFLCAVSIPFTSHAEEDAMDAEAVVSEAAYTGHALALHGDPKYGDTYTHFSYTNPDAPKGGDITMGALGSFDNLNPYILRGLPAAGSDMLYVSLMEKSLDEPMTQYGHLAKTITIPEDRSWVQFDLHDHAVWHDGKPMTAEDVVWTFNILIKEGQPMYRSYYAAVEKAVAIDAHTVRFDFKEKNNRELPLIVGDLPVLPKHYWTAKGRSFSKTTLTPPLGGGPYKFKSVEQGRRVVYERVQDWWGEALPINNGRHNFDTITYDYYRDPGVAFQAFLAGKIDFRQENVAKNWEQGYNHPAVRRGSIRKEDWQHSLPTGMQAFFMNARRDVFKDPKVREALAYLFDFEWSNKQFAFGSYVRSHSYFSNSEFSASTKISKEEEALLEPYRDQLPERVFSAVYHPPKTSGNGDIRRNMRQALILLREAGWDLDKGILRDKNGKAFEFEIMNDSPMFDRWLLPFVSNLAKVGIKARIREVDAAQYQNRMNSFDYDMIIKLIPQSLTPGNEQASFWSSEMADIEGSYNLAGIKNPVIDALLPNIIRAQTREDLTVAVRALDRVLQWHFYTIPQWYIDTFRVAYWDRLQHPAEQPPYGLPVLQTWWAKPVDAK